jgi:hypothetical protein
VVYCGRQCAGWRGSALGNPFKAGEDGTKAEVIQKYREGLWGAIQHNVRSVLDALENILALEEISHGHVQLGCWCEAGEDCHVDVIIRCLQWMKARRTTEDCRVDLSQANISAAQRKHLPKDQYKSDQADSLLATEGSGGATGEYLRLWQEAGRRVNEPQPGDVCFISANGKRSGAKPPPLELIRHAAGMGCSFVTDARSRRPEGGNPYNVGEQQVADALRALGYQESEEFGGLVCRWTR